MLEGLYSAATALSAAQVNQDIVSENLAHMNVPGFRKLIPSFESFDQVLQQSGEATGLRGRGVIADHSTTDFSAGPMAHTGRSLDVAINGDGFFAVETAEGEPLYTRNGVFFLSEDGTLTNSTGMSVLGENGTFTIPAGHSPSDIVIGQDGTVSVRGETLGKLRLVSFNDKSQLERAGTTLFRPLNGAAPEASVAGVAQGMREQANVSAIDEMVQMIKGARHYEAAQRALKSIDDSISNNTDPRK